jgi:hypothetical protein
MSRRPDRAAGGQECHGLAQRAPGRTYFQVLFTDQRGWNIRNDVCHGISPVQAFSWPMTDRIFHALLILATMRERKGKSGGQQ